MKIIKSPSITLLSYYGRSGSYFMHGLLEGADNILSLPCDMYIFWEWNKNNAALTDGEYIEKAFNDLFVYYFHPNQSMLIQNSIEKEFDVFKEIFNKLIPLYQAFYQNKITSRFIAFHHAFSTSRGVTFDLEKCSILYQIHVPCPHVIVEIMSLFANTKHIQMIREPLAGLASLIKTHQKSAPTQTDFSQLFVQTALGGMNISWNNGKSIGVKLESLHFSPIQTMKKVINFLELPWSASFLEETTLGQPPRHYQGFTDGFNFEKTLTNNAEHRLFFPIFDINRLVSLMAPRYQYWGYPIPNSTLFMHEKLLQTLPFEFAFENTHLSNYARKALQPLAPKAENRPDQIHFLLHYLAKHNRLHEQLIAVI